MLTIHEGFVYYTIEYRSFLCSSGSEHEICAKILILNDDIINNEVYKDDASLIFHLKNPPLVKFVEQHGEMGDDFSIEVYGTLSKETKEAFSASGFPIKYYDTLFGYSRVNE